MKRNDGEPAPKVSVIMTAYRQPEFIPEAIHSVLSQDAFDPRGGECEFILVDDGSPEDIGSLVAPHLDCIHYIRRENGGPGAARNTGVAAARGAYITFVDSDDVQWPHRLALQAALLDRYPSAGVTFADFYPLELHAGKWTGRKESSLHARSLGADESPLADALTRFYGEPTSLSEDLPVPDELKTSAVYAGRVPALVASRHVVWAGASMFRRHAFDEVGGFDEGLRHWEDWSLSSLISKAYDIVYWDGPVAWYRQHEGQQTKQAARVSARAYRDVVFEIWKDDKDFAKAHPDVHREVVKLATMRNAHYAAKDGEYRTAQRDLLHYIRAAPTARHGYTSLLRNVLRERVGDPISRRFGRASKPSE